MARRFQLRRDTAANWTSVNPVLAVGEPGFETDTGFMKVGDGASAWNALDYWRGGDALSAFSALTPAADRVAYYTGADTAALAVVTAFARSLLAEGNASSARALLEAASSGDVATISSTLAAVASDLDALEAVALVDSDVGTAAGKLVALDGEAKLPAVDGSNLTGIAAGGYESSWHPYNRLTAAGSETGEIYSFTADGVQANVVTPDFEDGWEYRLRFEGVGNNEPTAAERVVRMEVYRTTSADYFPAGVDVPALGGMESNESVWGEIVLKRPRFSSRVKMYTWAGRTSVSSFTNASALDLSVAQKITRVRLTLNGRSFAAGAVYMDRRRDYTSG